MAVKNLGNSVHTFVHGLRTPREEIAFTARPKIQSQSQIFRYGGSIFCLPHRPNFSDIFDLCLHWVSVVRVCKGSKKRIMTGWKYQENEERKKIMHGSVKFYINLLGIPNFSIPCGFYTYPCSFFLNIKVCIKYKFCPIVTKLPDQMQKFVYAFDLKK